MSYGYNTLLTAIRNIKKSVHSYDVEKCLEPFRSSNHFDALEETLKDFKANVESAVEDAERAVESPVYVGVVGHFSHGKSSLLNAMLLPPKTNPPLLPVGDSVVTSLCTLIQFDADANDHRYYEALNSGKEVEVADKQEYQRKVSGKASVTDTKNFRLVLSTKDLVSDVFNMMAMKRIELLDTPGLGGPYWDDAVALQRWVKEFKLLIVCIKADAINSDVADVINPFLKQTAKPIIPVVTFWDKWSEAEMFKNISVEGQAKATAKKALKELFEPLGDMVDNHTVFVAAKRFSDGEEVPKDLAKTSFSPEWNIDSVRRNLSTFVSDNSDILQSTKSQESALDRSRRDLVLEKCKKCAADFDKFKSQVEREIKSNSPHAEYTDVLDEGLRKFSGELENVLSRLADDLSGIVSDEVSTITPRTKLSEALDRIEQRVTEKYTEKISRAALPALKRCVEKHVRGPLEDYIRNDTPLDALKVKRLLKALNLVLDETIEGIKNFAPEEIFERPSRILDNPMGFLKSLFARKGLDQKCRDMKDKLKRNNTQKMILDRIMPQVDDDDVNRRLRLGLVELLEENLDSELGNRDSMFESIAGLLKEVQDGLREVTRQCNEIRRDSLR